MEDFLFGLFIVILLIGMGVVELIKWILKILGIIDSNNSDSSNNNKNRNNTNNKKIKKAYKNETTIYNYNAPGRTVSLDCVHCGATLELDLDNLIAKCPYCGHKILIDTTHLGQMFAEREKTKRELEKTNQEKERTERENLRYQYELEKQRLEIEAKERAEKRERRKNIFLWIIVALIWIGLIYMAKQI